MDKYFLYVRKRKTKKEKDTGISLAERRRAEGRRFCANVMKIISTVLRCIFLFFNNRGLAGHALFGNAFLRVSLCCRLCTDSLRGSPSAAARDVALFDDCRI